MFIGDDGVGHASRLEFSWLQIIGSEYQIPVTQPYTQVTEGNIEIRVSFAEENRPIIVVSDQYTPQIFSIALASLGIKITNPTEELILVRRLAFPTKCFGGDFSVTMGGLEVKREYGACFAAIALDSYGSAISGERFFPFDLYDLNSQVVRSMEIDAGQSADFRFIVKGISGTTGEPLRITLREFSIGNGNGGDIDLVAFLPEDLKVMIYE